MKTINFNERFDIQPIQLQEVCQQWQITELALFGSVLRHDFNSESDIDILVELKQGLTNISEKKQELKSLIENEFGKKVDIAREKYLKPLVKEEILKEVNYV